MEQVKHLREFDVEEISENWNSQYLFGQQGDSIGVLLFSEFADLQIYSTVTIGGDLISLDRSASVNSVERAVSWSNYPRYYYYRQFSVNSGVDIYEAQITFECDEFAADAIVNFEREQ